MNLKTEIKNEIAKKLANNFNICNVILFGSYAYGNPNRDSDIDLLVIFNNNETINSYSERIKKRVMISNCLIDIIKKTPIDILVYTADEWKKLLSSDSFFHQDINNNGVYII
ncbi:MAG: nucleotidyltransferase domain-containing protein [Bacteroidales bacterium]|nr:nucleotidyltransferase domain-containing protein [Bacteroidales bacterium]